MYYIPVPSDGLFGALSLGPDGRLSLFFKIFNLINPHIYIFRMEDAIDAFHMIFAGGQSWLPSWLIVYTLSVGLCFYSGICTTFQPNKNATQYYSGITVTKQMSGTARAVIAQVRKGKSSKRGLWENIYRYCFSWFVYFSQVSIAIVWVTFLLPLGKDLCRVQDFFIWTAVRFRKKTRL